MTERPLHHVWVVGRGGLLGSSVEQASVMHEIWTGGGLDWKGDDLDGQIDRAVANFVESTGDRDWAVIWCAGAGVVGTSLPTLQRETESLRRVLEGLRDARPPGRLFLSSSAGGVYGGSPDRPITESSEPQPLGDYGRNKLTQEAMAQQWSAATGHRVAIGRISNLYGPGQSLAKRQGLISQICLSTLLRQPISIYVSLDTIRDYVFADDCARAIVAMIERLDHEPPGSTVTKLLGSARSISIGGVLAESRRVLGRRPLVVLGSSPNRRLQGSTLAFRSNVWPELDRAPQTSLPAGIASVAESIRVLLSSGAFSSG